MTMKSVAHSDKHTQTLRVSAVVLCYYVRFVKVVAVEIMFLFVSLRLLKIRTSVK